jgi:hypothetical protein
MESQGLPVDDENVGVAPTVELLVRILAELDWPCVPAESDGWWYANVGAQLAHRLRDDPAAAITFDMVELFLRHHSK